MNPAVAPLLLRPADATCAYRSYLRRLANMLDDQPYLLGEVPCIADFAAYHPLWFTRTLNPGLANILDATPDVLEWMDRIAAIGHGHPQRMKGADAVGIGRPYIWGLASFGQEGVERVLEILQAELAGNMRQAGARSVAGITPAFVVDRRRV